MRRWKKKARKKRKLFKHRLDGRDDAARAQRHDRVERPFHALHPPLEGPSVCHGARVQQARADEKGGDEGEGGAREQGGGFDEGELDEHEGGVPCYCFVLFYCI